MITKSDIEEAYRRIRNDIVRTPLVYSQKMSRLCGCETLFKLENFQTTGSFKDRGALNKLLSLSAEERGERGHRGFRRQSCPGRRVSLPAPGDPGEDHHAPGHPFD